MAAHLVLVSFLFAFCGAQVLLSGNIITDVYVVTAYGTPSFDPSVLAQWYNFPLPFLNMLGTFTNCLPSIRQGAVLTITGGQLSGGVISELDFKTFVASLPSTANIPVFVLDVGITSFLDAVADFCGHHGNSGTRPYVVLSPFGQCGQGAVAQGVPLSFILQHEIAEMIANPFLTNGQAFEIGDTCALYSAFCPPQSIPQWIALTSPLTGSICYCDATNPPLNVCQGALNGLLGSGVVTSTTTQPTYSVPVQPRPTQSTSDAATLSRALPLSLMPSLVFFVFLY